MQDYYNSDELMHYGRKGMKWGQNIFGKVKTAAGKAKAKVGEEIAERKRVKAAEKLRKKPLSQCTDAELKARFSRAQLEKTVKDAEKNVEKVSAGEAFVKSAAKQVVGPALATAGKNVLTKWFESKGMDIAGLNKADPFADLKRDLEKVKLQRDISDNNRRIKENNDWFANPNKKEKDPLESLKDEKAKTELERQIAQNKRKYYEDTAWLAKQKHGKKKKK